MTTIPGSDPAQSETRRSERPRSARRLALHFCVVLVVASALAAALGGSRPALSVALGVALAGVNLVLMRKITNAMTAGAGDGSASAAWGLLLPFKLVALVGFAYALVAAGVAQPVPLAMGFALLPLTGVFLPRATSVVDSGAPARRVSSDSQRRSSSSRRSPSES